MSRRGPKQGAGAGVAVANARAAWPDAPEWVMVLARACDAPGASQTTVAKRIGYSPSAVSSVLKNKYGGDLASVEQAVRGALLKETVICPVVGEITRNVCLNHQKLARGKFVPTSAMRTRIYAACRETCEHSSIGGRGHAE